MQPLDVVTPDEILSHAEALKKIADSEIGYRNVIERAYYSAFHAAREFEEHLPFRSKVHSNTGSHDALLQRLERPVSELDYFLRIVSQDVGAQMRIFKPKREIATYDLQDTIRIDHAEDAIFSAKDILAECNKAQIKIKTMTGKG